MFAGLLCIQRPSRRRPVRRQAQDQEIAELRAERDGLKERLAAFLGKVVTCKDKNTTDWMEYLTEAINEEAEVLNLSQRAIHFRGHINLIAVATLASLNQGQREDGK